MATLAPSHHREEWLHVLGGIIAICIGAFALYALKGTRQQRAKMRSWPSAMGQITERSLERRTGTQSAGWVYTPAFRYTYAVDGVEHTGDTRKLAWKSGYSKGRAKRKLREVPDDVAVLYDPSDPATSALAPPGQGDVWFWGAFGVVLIVLGIYLLIS
jgi:hypothetical protein